MKRPLRWLPVLVLCELSLVWFDVLDLGDAVLILVAVEALLLVVGGHLLLSAIGSGCGRWFWFWRSTFYSGLWASTLPASSSPTAWKKRDCGCATVPLQKDLSSTPT